jgi:DNA excision repair protein ERCC-4
MNPKMRQVRQVHQNAVTPFTRISKSDLPQKHQFRALGALFLKSIMPDSPTIIIDTREQAPLVFEHLASERGTLQSGDYSIARLEHDFAIERKSISDLCGSLTRGRERFERELHRLRGFSFARVLIVGTPHEVQAQAANPKAVFSSISAFEARYKVPFIWEPSPELAARLVERWAWFFWRERSAIGRKAGTCPIPGAVVNGHTAGISLSPGKPPI